MLETPVQYPHLQGALAVVNARPPHSFRSPLSQKLLMHVNADLVRGVPYGNLTEDDVINRHTPVVQDQTMIRLNIRRFS